jgi:mitogen-activated protein kinase 1/3
VLAKHIPTGKNVAIKKVSNIFNNETDTKRLLREILILRQMDRHRNVVKLYDVIEPTQQPDSFTNLYYVFEAQKTDLLSMMNQRVKLTEYHLQTIMYNLLCGLHFIHSSGIIHRDLKPANVLINEDCVAKICDFGLSR